MGKDLLKDLDFGLLFVSSSFLIASIMVLPRKTIEIRSGLEELQQTPPPRSELRLERWLQRMARKAQNGVAGGGGEEERKMARPKRRMVAGFLENREKNIYIYIILKSKDLRRNFRWKHL